MFLQTLEEPAEEFCQGSRHPERRSRRLRICGRPRITGLTAGEAGDVSTLGARR